VIYISFICYVCNYRIKKIRGFAGCSEFLDLPSARARAPGKDFFKKFFAGCRPDRALGKENTKKK
jgi:hypothetical protein